MDMWQMVDKYRAEVVDSSSDEESNQLTRTMATAAASILHKVEGHLRLHKDYFHRTNPVFPKKLFRRRYRMSRDLFMVNLWGVRYYDPYFHCRPDAIGPPVGSTWQANQFHFTKNPKFLIFVSNTCPPQFPTYKPPREEHRFGGGGDHGRARRDGRRQPGGAEGGDGVAVAGDAGDEGDAAATLHAAPARGAPADAAVRGQVNAAAAMVNLSLEAEKKVRIVRSGAVSPLVDVLRVGHPEARDHAAGAIYSLAVEDENRAAIVVHDAILPLLELFASGSARHRARREDGMALYHISLAGMNRSKIARTPGVVRTLLATAEARDRGSAEADADAAALRNIRSDRVQLLAGGRVGDLLTGAVLEKNRWEPREHRGAWPRPAEGARVMGGSVDCRWRGRTGAGGASM
ncbi:hypothetical protein QYE76_031468 [Lolium multiflorum]|uniref:Uncharacterized protein n=1 Tax=Lolium multiflorum TaxID=4521 RepID=A0AAD8QSX4_LOLMU|nr:hypothetical protein QYE76_031468 [Lolium multiflorum]